MTATVSRLRESATWRSREVRYYSGPWPSILDFVPEFELAPFTTGDDEPPNPYLQTVVRLPLSSVERPIPVGVVSTTYGLAPHRKVAELCREGATTAGVAADELRYEVGVSELGEWMNFRVYFPQRFSIGDGDNREIDLRLECFNSVDGTSKLVILFGWYRLICSNGMVIGESKIEIKERHGSRLDLASIPPRIKEAVQAVERDRKRMARWREEGFSKNDLTKWANGVVAAKWGKKAAARVYHIASTGHDVEFTAPFASGPATQKPVRQGAAVPGSLVPARTKYDIAQILSFVASRRANAEERLAWQSEVAGILTKLGSSKLAQVSS